jgi:hypothetical protein
MSCVYCCATPAREEAAAGQEASLPMAVGRLDGDKVATVDVRFDPAVLIDF